MRVAEMLSDLTTLRPEVCDQKAALALVTIRPENTPASSINATLNNDPDLKRAQDLLELHSDVKLAHADGTDRELLSAREAVQRVLRDL